LVTSDGGRANVSAQLAGAVRGAGHSRVTKVHLATDHNYSAKSSALETAILSWLDGLSAGR